MVDSVSVRFKNARVEKMPSNIRIQWNAGTACVSECVLKTLACRGLRVGPSKLRARPIMCSALEVAWTYDGKDNGGTDLTNFIIKAAILKLSLSSAVTQEPLRPCP